MTVVGPDGPLTRMVREEELFHTGQRPVMVTRVVPRGPESARILTDLVPWLDPLDRAHYREQGGLFSLVPKRVEVSVSARLSRTLSADIPAGAGVVVAGSNGHILAVAGSRRAWAGDGPAGASLAPAVLAAAMRYGVLSMDASLQALGRRLGPEREHAVETALGLDQYPAASLSAPRDPGAAFSGNVSASLLSVADAYLPFATGGSRAALTVGGESGRAEVAASPDSIRQVTALLGSVLAGRVRFQVWAPPGQDEVAFARSVVVAAQGLPASGFRRVLKAVGAFEVAPSAFKARPSPIRRS